MIVIEASVLAPALSDDSDEGDQLRQRLRGQRLIAPELIDLEVQSVLRSGVLRGLLDERRARQAWGDLASMPLRRAGHRPLLPRAWALRDDLTSYDAIYVALAEALGATPAHSGQQTRECARDPLRRRADPAPRLSTEDVTEC